MLMNLEMVQLLHILGNKLIDQAHICVRSRFRILALILTLRVQSGKY